MGYRYWVPGKLFAIFLHLSASAISPLLYLPSIRYLKFQILIRNLLTSNRVVYQLYWAMHLHLIKFENWRFGLSVSISLVRRRLTSILMNIRHISQLIHPHLLLLMSLRLIAPAHQMILYLPKLHIPIMKMTYHLLPPQLMKRLRHPILHLLLKSSL